MQGKARRRLALCIGPLAAVGYALAILKESEYLNDAMKEARRGLILSAVPSPSVPPSSSAHFATTSSPLEVGAPDRGIVGSHRNDSELMPVDPEIGGRHAKKDPAAGRSPPASAEGPPKAPPASPTSTSKPTVSVGGGGPGQRQGSAPAPAGEFYSPARTDRSGASITDMIVALAHGYATNLTYRGACYVQNMTEDDAARRQADKEALIRALGLQDVLVFACPSRASRKRLVVRRSTYFDNIDALLTPAFLDWLRSKATAIPPKEPGGSAVVHVRRGDVDPCKKWRYRYLPNAYYVELVRRYVPADVPVIVYSEAASFEPFAELEEALLGGGGANGTDPSRSVSIRLDTDISEVWGAILAASHVVMSWSSFSYVPALLNGNATIVCPSGFEVPALPAWISADADIHERSGRIVAELVAQRCRGYASVPTGQSRYNATPRGG